MLNKQQKQELEALQKRWQALNQQINAMKKQLDLTTDSVMGIQRLIKGYMIKRYACKTGNSGGIIPKFGEYFQGLYCSG